MQHSEKRDQRLSVNVTEAELLDSFDGHKKDISNLFDDVVLTWTTTCYDWGYVPELWNKYMHLFRYVGQVLREIKSEPIKE